MKTVKYTTMNRTNWPRGLWDKEPDKVQWPDEKTGLPCLAVRSHYGNWCGYVGVAEGHPAFGKGYHEIDAVVHGGLTYADACNPAETPERGICHVVEPGEPDHVWWLGFDCGHAFDRRPAMEAIYNRRGEPPWPLHAVYRTLGYVKLECRKLAKQLAAMA